MTTSRDPLGKRALFSDPSPAKRPGTVTVHCSSCDVRTTLGIAQLAVQHFPVWLWLPWRTHSNLMRCPACGRLAWHSVS